MEEIEAFPVCDCSFFDGFCSAAGTPLWATRLGSVASLPALPALRTPAQHAHTLHFCN